LLIDLAKERGYSFISTGHYAIVEFDKCGHYKLKMGVDANKDQSYMLGYLNQDILSKILFPLGKTYKKDNLELGKKLGIEAVNINESQDLCFVKPKHYYEFINSALKGQITPGNIINQKGNILGQHNGLVYYTVGQRKGIRISSAKPYYVIRKNIENNELVVGHLNELGKKTMHVVNINWIIKEPKMPFTCDVKIRYRAPAISCKISKTGKSLFVKTNKLLRDITPGQYAAFYKNSELLGSGAITGTEY
ncbi:MAG: tRNA-specific 2-thiouridylase, partial [Anaerolineaceae bacterium]|nr:tRNA-specific 2-thiouridylase [Anaerolineaceae bacterium]